MTCQNPMGKGKRLPMVRTLLALLLLACAFTGCTSPDGKQDIQNMVNMGDWSDGKDSEASEPSSDTASDPDGVSSDVVPLERITPDSLTLGGKNGKKVYFGEDVTPLLAALGQWKGLTSYSDGGDVESAGEKKQYTYDGFSLLTWLDGDVERLDSVILTGDAAVTGEGLHVGMAEEQIGSLFGEGGRADNGVYTFTGGGVRVQLATADGAVTLIRYEREAGSAEEAYPLILVSDITVEQGSAIPFREYLLLADTTGEKIDLYDGEKVLFDGSAADPMKEGSYPLTVSVTGSTGKTAVRNFTVYVVPKTITEETVQAYVKGILEGTLAERLQGAENNEEKLWAVFQYISKESGMQYVDTSNKENPYYVEAYNGFTTLHGDCYTYCCMGQAMLEALGIDYRVVTRSGEKRSNHFWLLADFGDGWYHFDTCFHAFRWHKDTFKLTDGEVAAFTEWYNTLAPGWNYYQFDKDLHPRTPVLTESGEYTYLPYTVTYGAGEGGRVIGGTEQQILHGKKGEYVTAVPEEGYVFRRWSDGVSMPTRTDSPKENMSVTAEFVPAE